MAVNVESLKAAQARGLTVGLVPAPGTPLPLRLEIDDFIQDTELANLYFLALASYMSEEAAKTPFSYFEISGIHGQPNRSWNRQPPSSDWVPNTPNGDARRYTYCAHSSLVFPTWHRAYLAQFEQGLYVHAAALAPALRAEKVLERFRIPYFDPLLPRQVAGRQYTYGIPIILTLPRINVKRTADGPWTLMDNPLYSYKFSNADRAQMNFRSWGNLRNPSQFTMRAYDFQRDQPNHEILMRAFDNLYNPNVNLSTQGFDNLYRVMTDERQTWTTMSNSGRSGDLGMNSLEGFHDNLHVQISWGMPFRADRSPRGHMSNPDFAAFDPSFWLHHW
jgi:tyrosinase